jgi:hypothetical protein
VLACLRLCCRRNAPPRSTRRARPRPQGPSAGTLVGGGKSRPSLGSVPWATSAPSLQPSPSVSGRSGFVPFACSSPALVPLTGAEPGWNAAWHRHRR